MNTEPLYLDYMNNRPLIFAVDFDGTLCENKYPSIGKPNFILFDKLINEQKKGNIIILWTCRVGDKLKDAIEFCSACGLKFDYVNSNAEYILKMFKDSDTRKIYADFYIDDKSISPYGIEKRLNNMNREEDTVLNLLKIIDKDDLYYKKDNKTIDYEEKNSHKEEEEDCSKEYDNVNYPKHYCTGKFECIDVMDEVFGTEAVKNFCLLNAFKYLYRCNRKNKKDEDINKTIWYLNKYLDLEKEE